MSDLIRREDALQALINTDEIKGNAYTTMKQALEDIPAVDKLEERTARLEALVSGQE